MCAPTGRVEELKRWSQRVRGTRARKDRPKTVIIHGGLHRCASGGIIYWSGGVASVWATSAE